MHWFAFVIIAGILFGSTATIFLIMYGAFPKKEKFLKISSVAGDLLEVTVIITSLIAVVSVNLNDTSQILLGIASGLIAIYFAIHLVVSKYRSDIGHKMIQIGVNIFGVVMIALFVYFAYIEMELKSIIYVATSIYIAYQMISSADWYKKIKHDKG